MLQRWWCVTEVVSVVSQRLWFVSEVVADDTPAVDAVLKADKKRLALLAECSRLEKETEQGDRLKEVGGGGRRTRSPHSEHYPCFLSLILNVCNHFPTQPCGMMS